MLLPSLFFDDTPEQFHSNEISHIHNPKTLEEKDKFADLAKLAKEFAKVSEEWEGFAEESDIEFDEISVFKLIREKTFRNNEEALYKSKQYLLVLIQPNYMFIYSRMGIRYTYMTIGVYGYILKICSKDALVQCSSDNDESMILLKRFLSTIINVQCWYM
ncbi:MAG: hypothetical protein AAGF07_02405 [Patescibacteria group bacterium]